MRDTMVVGIALVAAFSFLWLRYLAVAEISVCHTVVLNDDHYFCIDSGIHCKQCPKDTFYIGTCKVDGEVADCIPCPPGTRKQKDYHIDRQCDDINGECISVVENKPFCYCLDTNFICGMCRRNTYYNGTCTKNNTDSKSCEPGTWQPEDFHMDKKCVPIPPSDKKSPHDGPVIQSPEESRLTKDQQSQEVKEVQDHQLDNNQGMQLSMKPHYLIFALWFCYKLMT